MSSQQERYDVAVIGAGIVGSAIARTLAGYDLSVALLDASNDVGDGASKANTGILHTGFDAPPGSLEARLVREGSRLLRAYAGDAGIPIEDTGAVLVAWSDEELEALPGLHAKAQANGYHATSIIGAAEVYQMVPNLGPGARGGLVVPDESIICTWTTNLALATDAVNRGVTLLLDHRVTAVHSDDHHTRLECANKPTVVASWVINAAGLGSAEIDRLFGFDRFVVTPRRGELIVFDKHARSLVDTIVLPVPSSRGKGVLITPTIYGNVALGPTSEDLDRRDSSTSETGLAFLLDKGRRLMPRLLGEEITATYAGLRAANSHGDYLVEVHTELRYLVVSGIRSTGLTSGMAVAEHVRDRLASVEAMPLTPRAALPPAPQMANIGEAFPRPYMDDSRIVQDGAYGRIVCFCERVTEGEIRDALTATIPAPSLEGLRRRTRAQMGRCQGFYCSAEVKQMLDASLADRSLTHAKEPR